MWWNGIVGSAGKSPPIGFLVRVWVVLGLGVNQDGGGLKGGEDMHYTPILHNCYASLTHKYDSRATLHGVCCCRFYMRC